MEDVENPLKSLEEIFESDRPFLSGTVAEYHRHISSIQLNDIVPVDVRQLFETAKNVMLYSRFAYRFNQVAEMVAFSALEFGLKELFTFRHPGVKLPNGLGRLLEDAKEEGIFQNDFFGDKLVSATQNGIRRELERKAEEERKQFGKSKSDPWREITEDEIADGIYREVAVDGYIKVLLGLRNDLAHGSKSLTATGFGSLSRQAELINYLFRKNLENPVTKETEALAAV